MFKLLIIGMCTFVSFSLLAVPETKNQPLDSLYREAQREFHRKNYTAALPLLNNYVDQSRLGPYQRQRLFWVIDQVGFIHLRVNKDPDKALKFFGLISKDKRLNDAESIDIEEWMGAARDWKAMGRLPKDSTKDQLFNSGRSYFRKGIKAAKSPRDDEGNAYFHIAATYLVPFIANHDSDERIAEALVMMGTIRRHVFNDSEYWTENFYLKEVIRRFPHTDIAMVAYRELENEIHIGFTGSAGDNTPPSVVNMLKNFKRLAEPKKKALK